jgi:hypothetical protein
MEYSASSRAVVDSDMVLGSLGKLKMVGGFFNPAQ